MAIKPKKPVQNGDVTIDRVAAAAGVSRATVSRVMNGSAKVSPEREKAVKKAIAAYNFTPNATARRLAGGRSGLVALLMEESSGCCSALNQWYPTTSCGNSIFSVAYLSSTVNNID